MLTFWQQSELTEKSFKLVLQSRTAVDFPDGEAPSPTGVQNYYW